MLSQMARGFGTLALPLGLLAAVVALPLLIWAIWRWTALRRIYGSARWEIVFDMESYAQRGPLRLLQLLAGAALATGIFELVRLTSTDPTSANTGVWRFVSLSGLLMLFVGIRLSIATAPAVLLLGPSSVELGQLHRYLNRQLRRYRVVSLLQRGESRFGYAGLLSNFRTRDVYQWRSIAFHLMDVVPLIVFCHDDGRAVQEEWQRLRSRRYMDRTLWTSLELLSHPKELSRIAAWVEARLGVVQDQDARDLRQQEFARIRASVPMALRYPRTLKQIVDKSQALENDALVRFLDKCKEGGAAAYRHQLLEDMPSLVSREEEQRYFYDDRAFEEIELLINSAQDVVGAAVYDDAFNRANLQNKRGKLARYRGKWDVAEREIGAVVAQLEHLLTNSSPADLPLLQRELGSAYYNLGDVFLGRHRESSAPDAWTRAKRCYEQSIEHDRKAGVATHLAEQRLRLWSELAS